jgi:hypothetical protein
MRIFRIEDFTAEELFAAAEVGSRFDVALVFSTKYEPPGLWFARWRRWQQWKAQFFGYHRDVPAAAAAQILGGELVYLDRRNGQWVGVIEMYQTREALSDDCPSLYRHSLSSTDRELRMTGIDSRQIFYKPLTDR